MADHELLHHFTEHPDWYFAPSIPYKFPFPHALQTLSLWIPRANFSRERLVSPAHPDSLWVIYIHGGAWRDPRITSLSFSATAEHLLSSSSGNEGGNEQEQSQKPHIAAVASLNYSLSRHADDLAAGETDPTRRATHPQHIRDVLTAIKFLQTHFRASLSPRKYILTGHSCGTTLALQTLMPPARLCPRTYGAQASIPVLKARETPAALVPIAGLYDLVSLVHDPGADHERIVPVYKSFLAEAFGDDEDVWRGVSPTPAAQDGEIVWGGMRALGNEYEEEKAPFDETLVALTQSREDTLVPWRQMEGMRAVLESQGWKEAHLEKLQSGKGAGWWKVQEVRGDHNAVWENGDELARVILRVVMWTRGRMKLVAQ